MLGGGINNIDLFGASQREARGKLEQMGGIKRPGPSGILASSTELMNAVGNAAAPAMPVRATGPATPMTPAPVPQAQVALPQVPAPMTVAPGPVQQAPAPTPAVPQPAAPTTPMRFQPGGPVTLNEQFRGYSEMGERLAQKAKEQDTMVVDITQDPVLFLENMDKQTGGAVTEKFGSTEKALQKGEEKRQKIFEAMDTEDEAKISDAVLEQAEVTPTDENKQDFARNVFGLEDVNDIDEINRRIADVAISSAIGKGPDEFAQAVLLGLQNYKQTASARAAGASGGVGSRDYRNAKDAYQDAFTQAMGVSDTEIPEGMTKEQYATQFAETVVRRTYTPEQIAAAGITMGSMPSGGGKSGPTLEEFLVEAQKINPDSTVEELTEFYTKRYGG